MIDGNMLRNAVMSAAISISNNKREVDELNVYPVPDGDTGTNMSMTMNSALQELERLQGNNFTVSQIAEKTASALLRGARGNSGVILSLIFRGFAKALSGLKTASCYDMANALELGTSMAYKAVMNPTEGTILTVVRLSAVKAQQSCQHTNDMALFWKDVCMEAEKALAQTPELLPVLKKAGVIDAGGKGLLFIFQAMLRVFEGKKVLKPLETVSGEVISFSENTYSTFEVFDTEDIHFSYCTEFIITKNESCDDALKLRAFLETIGDCVLVVDDEDIIKVHLHTNNPGKAIEKSLEFGYINLPKIENMRIQHNDKVKEEKQQKKQEFISVKPEKKYGFVAVAVGSGVEAMFQNLGVDVVVKGGQTMNPSTDDILKAIESTPAETVFVLPNNKNIIMAAEQAIRLADRKVCVLQTRTIPQGISAMLAFDENIDFAENTVAMTKALEKVGTGQVTFAVRDSEYEGHSIKKDEILAFENSKLSFTDKNLNKAVYKLTRRLIKSDTNYVTLIYGADVTDESAEKLYDILRTKINDKIEIMLINGGQPVYYYIISAE